MKSPQILHITKDEKFINAASYLFEKAFPGLNKFVVVKSPSNPPLKYIGDHVNAQSELKSVDTANKLALLTEKYAVTVLHGVDQFNGSVFLKSAHKKRFMSILFGAEIYNRPEIIGKEVMGEQTLALYKATREKTVIDFLKGMYRKLAYRNFERPERNDINKILYKMNVFGSFPSMSYDKYIGNKIYNPTVEKVPFSYYPLEFIIKNEDLRANGRDILFGNSAWPTNNHLEGFDLIKNLNLDDRKIHTPLSYGPKKYAQAIISQGFKLFPNSFKPLTEFLPLEEYNKTVGRCGIVIMNHYRPQAMGNIIASLYMGAKVFLNDTDAYRYFKKLGCYVFLIEKDLVSQAEAFQLLTEEQVSHNRQMLMNELSMPVLVEKMQTAFSEIFDFKVMTREVEV